jgi:protein AIR1/2
MSQPLDSESDESRTQHFRAKRTLTAAEGAGSGASTSSKRSRRSCRGPQSHPDFVPMGGSFPSSAQIINGVGLDAGHSSDTSAVSAHHPESHRAISMDKEESTHGPLTTKPSLPGDCPILGHNRLITGFAKTHNQPRTATQGDTSEVSRNDSTSRNSIGESADDAIEISDDTDMEDQSEDGGMVINVDDESADGASNSEESGSAFHANLTMGEVTNQASPLNESSLSDGEIKQTDKEGRTPTSRAKRRKCRTCGEKGHKKSRCHLNPKNIQTAPISSTQTHGYYTHDQLQGHVERSLSSNSTTDPNTGPGDPPRRLGDLSADEFERQVRYTLFHLKRDQIDINRPAICTKCLQQGHQETNCPESNCMHCGVKDEHPSRMCPKYRRCLKCRERGHDVDTCISKLRNSTVPCDYCGSETHLEDNCPSRFFPTQSQASATGLKLWISCCICASKTHLVGDCPERRVSSQIAAWSLRSLDAMQINNLSLESGIRKIERDVEIRGVRHEGLTIKGRADAYAQVQGNAAPSMRAPDGSQDESPRPGGQKASEDRDSERNRRAGIRRFGFQEDLYRPASDSRPRNVRYDRYESSYTDYRDDPADRRDKFYSTDSFGQRRRSRSPEFRMTRATQRNDSFQPPLPKEPLPSRPPRPSRPGASNRRQNRGLPGVDSYRPMPSAAKKAWDKHRL